MPAVKNSYFNLGQREDSDVKSLLLFQKPLVQFSVPLLGNSQPLITSRLGDVIPTPGLYAHLAQTWQTHTQTNTLKMVMFYY